MKILFRSLLFLGLSTLFISPAWAMDTVPMDTSEDEQKSGERNGRGAKRGAEQELTHEENPAKRARVDTTENSDAPDTDNTEMTDASNSSEQKNAQDSKNAKDAKTEEKTLKETALTLVPKLIPLQKEILGLMEQLAQAQLFNDFLTIEKVLVAKLAELGTMWSQNTEIVETIKHHIKHHLQLTVVLADFKPNDLVMTEIKKLVPQDNNDRGKNSPYNYLKMLDSLDVIKNALQVLQNHIEHFPFTNQNTARHVKQALTKLYVKNVDGLLQRTAIHRAASDIFKALGALMTIHDSMQFKRYYQNCEDLIIDIDEKDASWLFFWVRDEANKIGIKEKPIKLRICFNSCFERRAAWYMPADNAHYITFNVFFDRENHINAPYLIAQQLTHALPYENIKDTKTEDVTAHIRVSNKLLSLQNEILQLIEQLAKIKEGVLFKSKEEVLLTKLKEFIDVYNKKPEITESIKQHMRHHFRSDANFKPQYLLASAIAEHCSAYALNQHDYDMMLHNLDHVINAVKILEEHIDVFPFADIKSAIKLLENWEQYVPTLPTILQQRTDIHRNAKAVFECLAQFLVSGDKQQMLAQYSECKDVIIEIDEKEAPKLYEMARAYAKILGLKMPVQLRLCFNHTENNTLAWHIWRHKSSSDVHLITFNMNRIFEARTLAHELGHALQNEKGIKYDDWYEEIDADLIAEVIMAKSSDRVTWEKSLFAEICSIAHKDTSSRKGIFERLGTFEAEEQHVLKTHWPDEWAAFAGRHSSHSFSDQQLFFAQYLHNLEWAQVKAGKLSKNDRFYTHPPYLLVINLFNNHERLHEKLDKFGLLHVLPNTVKRSSSSACAMDLGSK